MPPPPPVISVTDSDSSRKPIVLLSTGPSRSADEQHATNQSSSKSHKIKGLWNKLRGKKHQSARSSALEHRQQSPASSSSLNSRSVVQQTPVVENHALEKRSEDSSCGFFPPSTFPSHVTETAPYPLHVPSTVNKPEPKPGHVPRASTTGTDVPSLRKKRLRRTDTARAECSSCPYSSRQFKNETEVPEVPDLGNLISERMAAGTRIGLDRTKEFVSDEELGALITDASIAETLPHAPSGLLDFIRANKTMFAITLLVFSGQVTRQTNRQKAMESFSKHEFSDEKLPVADSRKKETRCGKFNANECKHWDYEDAFHLDLWNYTSFQSFFDKQWNFALHTFQKDDFENHLDDRWILPLQEVQIGHTVGEGHFSVVYKAKMLADYQDTMPHPKVSQGGSLSDRNFR